MPDIEFKMHMSGLLLEPNQWDDYNRFKHQNKKLTFVETVEDRKKWYSKRQVKQAEVARAGLHNAGFPSEQDFRIMVQNGLISICPFQVDDVDQAKHIHGKDVGLLKGKTTRHKSLPVVENIVPVPKQILTLHKNVFLTVDLFHVNKIVFLITHIRGICLTIQKLLR